MCINYALLGFYLCYFRMSNSVKRFNSALPKIISKILKMYCFIYNNGNYFIQRIERSRKNQKNEGYKRMSEDELLKVLEESEKPKPLKTIKEIRKAKYDSNEIIRDLSALYESGAFNDNYIEYESNRIKIKDYLLKGILI